MEAMVKLVENQLPVRKVGNLNLSRVKPITYKIDTCCYLAWRSALIGYDKDWFVQYHNNVTVEILGPGPGGGVLQ